MINGHGNDIHNYEKEIVADFSSNLFPGKPPVSLIDHLSNKLIDISDYPQSDALALQKQIARHHGVGADHVVATNGATEAFYLMAHLYKGSASTILIPSFSEYEDACRLYGHTLKFFPSGSLDINPEPNLVWMGNPNNPDGKTICLEEIRAFCNSFPQTTLIIDEAYAELTVDFQSAVPFVNELDNLVVIRSLTKSFVIPGLRLGYLIAGTAICKRLIAYRMPWSVNSLAIEAGLFIMEHYQDLLPCSDGIINRSVELQEKLNSINKIDVLTSKSNFFLARLIDENAGSLKKHLLDDYGLLIRDASNFRGLDSSYFRLAVQDEEHNEKLLKAIKKWAGT